MHRYQNNAFRVLGLMPSASMQEILSRADEIKVKKSLGFDVQYEFDFPWLGPIDRRDENVIHSLQQLEDPISRLREELSWFWIESDDDRKAINYLAQNKRQEAHQVWRSIANEDQIRFMGSVSNDIARACHNQAVLAHSSVISKEVAVKYKGELKENTVVAKEAVERRCCPQCERTYDDDWKMCLQCGVDLVVQKIERKERRIKSQTSDDMLTEAHWKNWRFALNKFIFLASSDAYWTMIGEKIKKANDPRLTGSKISSLKDEYVLEITKPNLAFISRALISKDYERTKQHSNLLNGLNVSSNILKNGFNLVLGEHIAQLTHYSEQTTKEINQFKDPTKESVMSLYSRFSERAKDLLHEGTLVDINCVSDFSVARDTAAGVFRNFSVEVHNKFNDFKKSYEMISEAIECAASAYLKQRFEKDAESIKRNLVFAESKKSEESKTKPFNIWALLKGVPWWLWLLGFFIVISLFSESSTKQSSTTRYKPQQAASTTSGSQSLREMRERIMSAKESIKNKESRLEQIDAQIKIKEDELTAAKSYIDGIEARYSSSTIPYQIQSEYERRIDEYNNTKLPQYKRLISEREALYQQYEQEIESSNRLVDAYNKRIR